MSFCRTLRNIGCAICHHGFSFSNGRKTGCLGVEASEGSRSPTTTTSNSKLYLKTFETPSPRTNIITRQSHLTVTTLWSYNTHHRTFIQNISYGSPTPDRDLRLRWSYRHTHHRTFIQNISTKTFLPEHFMHEEPPHQPCPIVDQFIDHNNYTHHFLLVPKSIDPIQHQYTQPKVYRSITSQQRTRYFCQHKHLHR